MNTPRTCWDIAGSSSNRSRARAPILAQRRKVRNHDGPVEGETGVAQDTAVEPRWYAIRTRSRHEKQVARAVTLVDRSAALRQDRIDQTLQHRE